MKRLLQIGVLTIATLGNVLAGPGGRLFADPGQLDPASSDPLLAGAATVDVTPRKLPVIVNGGFLERTVDRISDPLSSRALVLAKGDERLAVVIVDSCMIPLDVCDAIKQIIQQRTLIPPERVLIAATHTHAAPSAMDYCLGSSADRDYIRFLVPRVAESVHLAANRLQRAEVGAGRIDAGPFCACRRWITRPDKMLTDPFSQVSVRAMMHPGYQNPDYLGPAGPTDPWLTLFAVRSEDGRPIAVLANFSMHYFGGHAGLSSDYFGLFSRQMQRALVNAVGADTADADADTGPIVMMSQGTSGDIWRADYSQPARDITMDEYSSRLVDLAMRAYQGIEFDNDPVLGMVERRITLERRLPNEERLAWARHLVEQMGQRKPRTRPEVYAMQAIYLHENPTDELALQVARVGDFAVYAIPNEVYAITGLKLKSRSPFAVSMSIELANGASGYIPPPEQHALGGYTTWPARTAGLEVQAEPKIVEQLLQAAEQLSGRPRRQPSEARGRLASRYLRSQPAAWWRFGQMDGATLPDATSHGYDGQIHGHAAYYLDGVPDRSAEGERALAEDASRSIQLAGGWVQLPRVPRRTDHRTLEFWFENRLAYDVRPVTAELFTCSAGSLVLEGTQGDGGRLRFGGQTSEAPLELGRWHQLVIIQDGRQLRVHVDGKGTPELTVALPASVALIVSNPGASLGGHAQGEYGLEGKLDEAAVFDRVLTAEEIAEHYQAVIPPDAEQPQLEAPPLDPDESVGSIHVPEGFQVQLVASEPLVQDPVAIDFGPDGRLWVVEMADYPYGMDGQGAPGGRVRWLKDIDGDGKYDQGQVFADRLSFPTGVKAWGDGVLVTAAPHILLIRDTDADGLADERAVLYDGFVQGNQQLRVNGLRYGLDNWLYCASGGHHPGFGAGNEVRIVRTGQAVALGSRDFRIPTDWQQLEPLSGPSQFGRVRDDWGNWFGVQNSFPLWHYVLEDRYLRRNPFVTSPDPRQQLRLPPNPPVYPAKEVQKRFHGPEMAGHFTSACGPTIYRDQRLFATTYDRQIAFTCEPFHNLVQRSVLTRTGATFTGRRADDGQFDFFASRDRWCRPVMVRTGPDGALWVVDMYRYMIEHPDWLPEAGKRELKPFYRSGESRGRIYRVVRVDDRQQERGRGMPPAASSDNAQLVRCLNSTNGPTRDLAQQLLVARHATDQINRLRRLARNSESDVTRLSALATLAGLRGADDAQLLCSLSDSHAGVRRFAIELLEGNGSSPSASMAAALLKLAASENDQAVRLQLALAAGQWPSDLGGPLLVQLAGQGPLDDFMVAALLSSALPHIDRLASDMSLDHVTEHPDLYTGLLHTAQMSSSALAQLIERLSGARSNVQATRLPAARARILARWLQECQERGKDWRSLATEPELARAVANLHRVMIAATATVADRNLALEDRVAAVSLLGRREADLPRDVELLLAQLSAEQPTQLQLAALRRLMQLEEPMAFDRLLALWPSLLPEVRRELIEGLLSRTPSTRQLLAAMQMSDGTGATIRWSDLNAAHQQRLLDHADETLRGVARSLAGSVRQDDREQVIDQYRQSLRTPGDALRGKELFVKQCGVCHLPGSAGESLGPDLRSVSRRTPASLLESILAPSRQVEPRYLAYHVALADGRSLSGVVSGETSTTLRLRQVDGQERAILRDSIEQLQATGRSFMPDGWERNLSVEQMSDLLAYLVSQMESEADDR